MTTHLMRVLLVLLLSLRSLTASADEPAPWAKGVPTARQNHANELFEEANILFAQQAYPAALERYRGAIALWDHPQIRFNMAVTLMRLGKDIEALDVIDAAMEFGPRPFTPDVYRRGLEFQRELKSRIGTIEASCTQSGVTVSLDGQPWFTCPGTRERRVTPGAHAIVAEGPDLMTMSRRIAVSGGKVSSTSLTLFPVSHEVVAESSHRWAPWVVAGLGVATAAAGAGVWFKGYRGMADADARLDAECPCDKNSPAYLSILEERARAEREGKIGTGLVIGGGVVVLGGVVWALVQRPSRRRPVLDIAPTGEGLRAAVGWQF